MDISPQVQRKIKKVLENKGDIGLAQLESILELSDKLEDVAESVRSIEMPHMPEHPSSIVVQNLPEIQRVEVVNQAQENDDTEVKSLLKELIEEVKKKEENQEYDYDVTLDPSLKEELRGEPGQPGLPGERGDDGSPDTPDQVVEKVIESDKLIPKRKIEGLEDIENIAKNNQFRDGVSSTTLDITRQNLQRQIDTKIEGVNTHKLTTSQTEPLNPQPYDIWIQIP